MSSIRANSFAQNITLVQDSWLFLYVAIPQRAGSGCRNAARTPLPYWGGYITKLRLCRTNRRRPMASRNRHRPAHSTHHRPRASLPGQVAPGFPEGLPRFLTLLRSGCYTTFAVSARALVTDETACVCLHFPGRAECVCSPLSHIGGYVSALCSAHALGDASTPGFAVRARVVVSRHCAAHRCLATLARPASPVRARGGNTWASLK